MFYACIAIGMADCLPDQQIYVSGNIREFGDAIAAAIGDAAEEFESDCGGYYRHAFRFPRPGQDNWSQRILIGKESDRVLDIIGMTRDEFERESVA